MNLNQVTILTNDTLRLARFYELIGLKLIVDSLPRYARFEFPHGSSTFSIHSSENEVTNTGLILYFECEDVDFEFKRLKKLGIEFETGPRDQEWLWREVRLKDPDGNPLILFQAGENRRNPPWRISG